MTAILPSLNIDDDIHASKYFLPYQMAWILDQAQMQLAEKSVRIGWTYADAFKNVRKRLHHKNRDYLFSTKDHPTAVEYVTSAYKFCEIYNYTKSVVLHTVEDMKLPTFDEEGRATGFTEDVKVGIIKFDTGSRIIAFSSNPNALRAFGGDVGLDEFAFHPKDEALWASASGRIQWGHDISVWSSHNGDGTLFHVFVQEGRAGQGGWSFFRVTIEDAIEMGLVEKINEVSGKNTTREEFLANCKVRSRLDQVYQQEYMCNPVGGTSAIVPWAAVARCMREYEIERLHLEDRQIKEQFGEFDDATQLERERRIAAFIRQGFNKSFSAVRKNSLGFDVAASGQGDLAAIYNDERGSVQQLRSLFTCRTDDWHFLKTVLWTFMQSLTDVKGSGDETGLGRQICWETAKKFPGRFNQVNFSKEKSDMGFALMNRLSVAEKLFPKGEKDIAADFYALRKLYSGKRWIFSEGSNTFNPNSHCDISWGGALSDHAADTNNACGITV